MIDVNIIGTSIGNYGGSQNNPFSRFLKDKLNIVIGVIEDIQDFIRFMHKLECSDCFNEFPDEWKRACIDVATICDILAGHYISGIKITVDEDGYPEVNLRFKKDVSSKDKVMILNRLSDEIEKISNGDDGLLDVSITIA